MKQLQKVKSNVCTATLKLRVCGFSEYFVLQQIFCTADSKYSKSKLIFCTIDNKHCVSQLISCTVGGKYSVLQIAEDSEYVTKNRDRPYTTDLIPIVLHTVQIYGIVHMFYK